MITPEQQVLLSQLQDIALPDPIGWWPLSHLAWVLIVGISGFLSGFIWYKMDKKRRHYYRKEAQQQLKAILQSKATSSEKILRINALLKQAAITYYGRQETAALSGQAWVEFLKTYCVSIPQPVHLLAILQKAYAAQATADDLQILSDYAQKWLKGHHQ